MKKICHLTTVHNRYDGRIFQKECRFLSNYYEVHLIVSDGQGDEICKEIQIHDVGKSKNRFWRMLKATKCAFRRAVSVDADLYHIHDSELWPTAIKLRKLGKKVVFDAHEDFPNDLFYASYLNDNIVKRFITRYIIVPCLHHYQRYVFRKLNALIAATPYIRGDIEKINPKTVVVYNYFDINSLLFEKKLDNITNFPNFHYIVYGGTISKEHGIMELVKSLKLTKNRVKLRLLGRCASENYESSLKRLSGWEYVDYLDYINFAQMGTVYEKSEIGYCAFPFSLKAKYSCVTKLFEFMYYKLPVIGSKNTSSESIIRESKCGLLVKPGQADTPQQIAKCIDYLIEHPEEAKQMGENGRKAVLEHYNMNESYKVLLNLYKELLD